VGYVCPTSRRGVRSPDTGHSSGRPPDGRLRLRFGLMRNGGKGKLAPVFQRSH